MPQGYYKKSGLPYKVPDNKGRKRTEKVN